MPFSDGAWYDPQEKVFKLWYMGGYARSTCYATSADGIHWDKPALDVRKGTNVVQPESAIRPPYGSTWKRRIRSGVTSCSAPARDRRVPPVGG